MSASEDNPESHRAQAAPQVARAMNVLAAALGFATRLPVSWLGVPDEESFVRARSLLPLVGGLIGGASAFVGVVVHALLHDPTTAAIVAVASTIALTGALHEDGLADVCDGIGGGSERERVLSIMRDSRLGSFGVLGLVLSTGLRIRLLALLLEHRSYVGAALALVASHVIARTAAVFAMDRHPYARREDLGANATVVGRPFEPKERAIYVIPAVVFAVLATDGPMLHVITLTLALALSVGGGALFSRWLSGVTGDCLGAIEQVTEIAVLAAATVGTLP